MENVKTCLQKLVEENIDLKINKHVKYLIENVEEQQLLFKLSQSPGIAIDGEMIKLWYIQGVGFQCKNMYREKYGSLPICNRIERFLNQELYKS